MHPIRDFQPTIRFSDIKLWFSSRQQNLIQGIRKIRNNHEKVVILEGSLEKTNEKYIEIQNQQVEMKQDITKLQKSLDKQNKKLDEVVWLLKTQFEHLEENTVDQLLEMKQREKVLDSDIKKRLKMMKKSYLFQCEISKLLSKNILIESYSLSKKLRMLKNLRIWD